MITINYCKGGEPVSDFAVSNWVENVLSCYREGMDDYTYPVSTTSPITALRLAIAKDEIPAEAIKFKFGDKEFFANEYGRIGEWPKGFADLEGDLVGDLLTAACEKRRCKVRELSQ